MITQFKLFVLVMTLLGFVGYPTNLFELYNVWGFVIWVCDIFKYKEALERLK